MKDINNRIIIILEEYRERLDGIEELKLTKMARGDFVKNPTSSHGRHSPGRSCLVGVRF